jgi:hypothetical protein
MPPAKIATAPTAAWQSVALVQAIRIGTSEVMVAQHMRLTCVRITSRK